MVAIGVITPFMVPLKVTAMVAFVLSLPFILYQAWAFIAPGLYAHEKRLGIPLIISSTLLFISACRLLFLRVRPGVQLYSSFAPKSITPAPDIEAYLSFVMTMFLAFGIAFEVPVALVVLVKLGIVTVEKLKEWRSYFIVGAFVVAAVVTPPDVVSQLALAIPMCLLYELGILASRLVSRPQPAVAAEGDAAAMDAEMDKAEESSASCPKRCCARLTEPADQAGFYRPGRVGKVLTGAPSSNHHSVPGGMSVQVSLSVSGRVAITATRSSGEVTSLKSTVRS
jgi:sec-independent protein translocase protein TatC